MPTTDEGIKPNIFVNPTRATFTKTSTTYSDPTVQYSSSTQVYGGVDQKNEIPPSVKSIDDVRPSFERVGNAS